jgi:hypothetical protein
LAVLLRAAYVKGHGETSATRICRGVEHDRWLAVAPSDRTFARTFDRTELRAVDSRGGIGGAFPDPPNTTIRHRAAAKREARVRS